MRFRTLLVALCVLALADLPAAQTKTATADRLSGTWVGDMGPNETDRHAITVTLKSDGKALSGLITGPPYPGEIKSVSFDPATGALRLDIVVQNDERSLVVFEGKLVNGTARGTVNMDGRKGTFTLTRKGSETAAPPTRTQAAGKRTPEQMDADFAAHKGDFDYLLGDWEFSAESKEHGKFRGYWSAVGLEEGQVLDEYRVTGDKGETYYVTTTLRNYNKVAGRWELIGADAGAGLQDFGTARKVGDEIHIEQRFGVSGGEPSTWRIRYYNIKKDSFSWTADRSTDGGKTWVKNHQTIEARRIGPPRTMGALAPARKTS